MNLGEIIDTVKSLAAQATTLDLDAMIIRDVNRAYRKLCRSHTFGALIVRGEQIDTVAGVNSYVLPYPLERIINYSLRYDVTDSLPGCVVPIRNTTDSARTVAGGVYPNGFYPLVASLGRGTQATILDNVGSNQTVSTDSLGTTITLSGAGFTTDMVGYYIKFGTDANGKNGGDYGYRIDEVDTGSNELFFESGINYRGATLNKAAFQIRPSNSLWLTFDPQFVDTAKVAQYDWYSKPQRLYGPNDTPEVPELSDAIAYQVLAENPLYHRPQSYDRLNYVEIARGHLMSAIKAGLQ